MTPVHPFEVAGLSLRAPRLVYEAENPLPPGPPPETPPQASWSSASLARPHVARALDGATLTVRASIGDSVSTFELTPFVSPAVQPYLPPPPAAAWRALLVEQRLLCRPEMIWTGAFPDGWDTGLAAPWAEELAGALAALHRRYRSRIEERSADYTLRSIECAECRAARAAKLPPGLPPWQVQMRLSPIGRCQHVPHAMRAVGALCEAHPELTFELLGWMEPAGARAGAEGPPVTRFALTGPVMEALLGPWLIGEDRRLASRTTFCPYAWSSLHKLRSPWGQPKDPRRPDLPRAQRAAVSLAASAWGLIGEPEALVEGDASAGPPELDRTAAPPIETLAALPGEPALGKAARARRRRGRP